MDVNPAVSHMFIVNPLSAKRLMNLFSTHPTIEDRVRRLQNSNL
ncbi:protease HtpX, partial [Clostridium beijerinckii]|nr:protease HtpX [Clostridium beijerinckii]MBC2425074.1 protease HtpX [Clostridium beijerinckii]MBC2434575.1 protease HtpX [Clostridium beijerinckii]MBC2492113.1 protease HtpX [Clostridium beijerinckii]MBC2531284.1 protease HtpX [Clostridium beijerinckii]